MARNQVFALIAVTLVALLALAFIWAPIVPFERLASINAPTSPDLCPGTAICHTAFSQVWVRSYASFGYDLFGFGMAPFTGPVSVEKNGVVEVLLFNGTAGTSQLMSVEYPVSSPEPLPLIRVNGLTVYPHGAPFGGTVTQISVTNMGVGETAEVYWGNQGNQQVPAGGTVLVNSTDWTGGPLPVPNSNYTVSFTSTIHYPKLWLYALTTQSVKVTYSS
ncbi:MAG: hypothetical protein OK438_06895 [Thaumarchaeota archaeon]|nr:hypothetical protein [Nitrososphaerota archaeon]